VLISLPYAAEPIDEYTTQSVMHDQRDGRPTITLVRNQPLRLLPSAGLEMSTSQGRMAALFGWEGNCRKESSSSRLQRIIWLTRRQTNIASQTMQNTHHNLLRSNLRLHNLQRENFFAELLQLLLLCCLLLYQMLCVLDRYE